MYIERHLTSCFKTVLTQFPAVLITGPRQSGKSTFLQRVLPDMRYITFDEPLNRNFAIHDPNGFLDQFKGEPVVFDEIQYVPDILQYIKIRIDQNRKAGTWILTGSQQFHLMKNVSETLAGRIAILELPPFSFSEVKNDLHVDLEDLFWTGLYPDPACYPEKRSIWLRSYIQTYIERDVLHFESIKNLKAFETFIQLSAAFHSQEFKAAELARECGVSQPTIASWRRILEASYLNFSLPPFYKNYGKRIIKSSKFYFFDPALVCYLTRQPSRESTLSGSMAGPLFEGFVICEVLKLYYEIGERPPVFFWRSQNGLEVDLIIEINGKLLPVEIKLTATPTIKHADTLNLFKKIAGEDSAEQGIVVCRVSKQTVLPGNNTAMPWYEFFEFMQDLLSQK